MYLLVKFLVLLLLAYFSVNAIDSTNLQSSLTSINASALVKDKDSVLISTNNSIFYRVNCNDKAQSKLFSGKINSVIQQHSFDVFEILKAKNDTLIVYSKSSQVSNLRTFADILKEDNFDYIDSIEFVVVNSKRFSDSLFSQSKYYYGFIELQKDLFFDNVSKEGGLYIDDIKSVTNINKPQVTIVKDSLLSVVNDYSIIKILDSIGYNGYVTISSKDSSVQITSSAKISDSITYNGMNSHFSLYISPSYIDLYLDKGDSSFYRVYKKNYSHEVLEQLITNLQFYNFQLDSATFKLSIYDNTVDKISILNSVLYDSLQISDCVLKIKSFKFRNNLGKKVFIFKKMKQIKLIECIHPVKVIFYKSSNQTFFLDYSIDKLESIYKRYLSTYGNFCGEITLKCITGSNGKISKVIVENEVIGVDEFIDFLPQFVINEFKTDLIYSSIFYIRFKFNLLSSHKLVHYKMYHLELKKYITNKSTDSINYLTRTDIMNTVNDSSKRIDRLLSGRAAFNDNDSIAFNFNLEIDNRGNVITVNSDSMQITNGNISVMNSIYFDIGKWKFKKSKINVNYVIDLHYSYTVPDSLKQDTVINTTVNFKFNTNKIADEVNNEFSKFMFIGGIAFNGLDSLKSNLYNHSKISSGIIQKNDKLVSFSASGYSFYGSVGYNYPNYILNNFILGLYVDGQYQLNNELSNIIFFGSGVEMVEEYTQRSYWAGLSLNVYYSIMKNVISLTQRDDFLFKFSFGRTFLNGFYLDKLREDDYSFRYIGKSDNDYYTHLGILFNKRINGKFTGVELGYKTLFFKSVKHQNNDSNITYSEIDEILSTNDLELDLSGLVFRVYYGF